MRQDVAFRPAMRAVAHPGRGVEAVAANPCRVQRSPIGPIIPDFRSPFLGGLATHLERHADAAGYRLAVVSSRENPAVETAEIQTPIDWRVAET